MREKLIDANELWQQTFVCEEPGDFRKAIENAPTVDAVEVVRCKDCKHRYTLSSGMSLCKEHFPMGAKDDDFCSYGERRSE